MCLEFTQQLPTLFVGLTGWPNASTEMTLDIFTTTPNVTIGLIQKYFLWSPVLIQKTKSIWIEWNWWKLLVKGQILAKFVQEEAATTKFDLNLNLDQCLCGSCHVQNVLIDVEYRNCRRTLDVYLLFAVWMGPIQSKLIHIFVTYGLASL